MRGGRHATALAAALVAGIPALGCADLFGPDAPALGPIPAVADHDIPYDVTLDVTGPGGEPVEVRAVALPRWLTFDPETLRLYGTPGESALGTAPTVRWEADNGKVTTRIDSIRVRVGTSRFVFDGPWVAQTPHDFGHDQAPVETAHFRVYGGHTAQVEREDLAAFLEETLDSLTARLEAKPAEYEFPPDGRLHVFADKLQGDRTYGYNGVVNGWAFRDGLIAMAWDAPRRTRQGYDRGRYESLVRHELMHAVEFLLIGRDVSIGASDAWFREGIATYMGGMAPGGIDIFAATSADAAQWRSSNAGVAGQGNPIGIHTFNDFPSGANTASYYLWFSQAIRYLVDDRGFGLGEAGLRVFYEDLRAGYNFAYIFEQRTGVSLATFEDEFWDRIEAVFE